MDMISNKCPGIVGLSLDTYGFEYLLNTLVAWTVLLVICFLFLLASACWFYEYIFVLLIAVKNVYGLLYLQLSFYNLLLTLAGPPVQHCLPLHDRELSRWRDHQRSLPHLQVCPPHGTTYQFLGGYLCAAGNLCLQCDHLMPVSSAGELSARLNDGHPPQTR